MTTAFIPLILGTASWAASKETVLYTFQGGADGDFSLAGLIADPEGNLYGTTAAGGDSNFGTVFKLSPDKKGDWTKTTILSFQGLPVDGAMPSGRLVFDAKGNLYGTTTLGSVGDAGEGTVYELTPTKQGPWKETILHSFDCFSNNDGCLPQSSLIFNQAGNLYGTTLQGGGGDNTTFCTNGCGTVFKLSPNKDGSWRPRSIPSLTAWAARLTARIPTPA